MNLTPKIRAGMPSSSFGLPKTHGFPMNDAPHARLAIPMAARSFHAGNISSPQMHAIQAKARMKLGKPSMNPMNARDALVAKLKGGL